MLSKLLEWIVVAIPVIVGFVAWVFPIQHARATHRLSLFVGCVIFSGLIYWQQSSARRERSTEFEKPPGKIASEVVKIMPKDSANAKTSRWGLTADQLALLSRRVAAYAPAKDRGDLITCSLGDPSATKFAAGLVAAFRNAGWKLPGSGYNQAVFGAPIEGIFVKLHAEDDRVNALSEFVATLREAGIEPKGEIDGNIPAGEFQIVVGAKPEE
jgi:hypothetical protein